MTKISVVIPTYNQASYLPVCLDSIWFQEYADLEIIVVDDGSTDRTTEILEEYNKAVATDRVSYAYNYNEASGMVERKEHFRYSSEGRTLRILKHPKNKGLGAALNTGSKAVTGDYVTFIASDDMLLPSAVSEMAFVLEQGTADFVYADMHIVDDSGRILRRFTLPDYRFEISFGNWYLCGICKLYRRELHEKFGYYNEAIKPQDHEMFLRFAMNGARFTHIPKVLAHVRTHGEERAVGNHSPANWNRLYEESAALVMLARRHLARRK